MTDTLRDVLAEFDGSVCPACHHRAHDPGACSDCPRCELHTDEALAFVLRYEPELLARGDAPTPEPRGLREALEWLRGVTVDEVPFEGTGNDPVDPYSYNIGAGAGMAAMQAFVLERLAATESTDTLREAAQAVVSGWIDDETGMETFDPELIDRLADALAAREDARP